MAYDRDKHMWILPHGILHEKRPGNIEEYMCFHATYLCTCSDRLYFRSLLSLVGDHAQQLLSIKLCGASMMENTGLSFVRSRRLVFSFSRFRPVMDDIEIATLLDI